jgi:O-antigen/teichoic acid export membrane protein
MDAIAPTDDLAGRYEDAKRRAVAGSGAMLTRHVLWALISLAGSAVLIRSLGPAHWASYGIAYFLILAFDNAFGASFLGRLVRTPDPPDARDREAAAALMALVGVGALALFAAISIPAANLYGRRELAGCLAGAGVCALVYSSRATSVALLERDLRYRTVAAAELLDQATFYVLAIALVAAGQGLRGVAIALAVRGVPAAVFLRRRQPSPRLGHLHRDRLRGLLGFGTPAMGASALVLLTGLVPAVVLGGGHARILGFVLASATILGYASTAQVIVQRVGFPTFASLAADPARLGSAIRRTVHLNNTLVVPLVASLGALSPVWLPLLLGSQWRTAAPIFVGIAAGYAFSGVSAIGTTALQGLGHPGRAFRLQAATTALYAGAAFPLVLATPRLGVPIAWSASRAFAAGLAAWLVRRAGHSLASVAELAVLCVAAAVTVGLGALTRSGGGIEAAAALAVLVPCWFALRRDDFTALWSSLRNLRGARLDPAG